MKKIAILIIVCLSTIRLSAQKLHTSDIDWNQMTQSTDNSKMLVITSDAISMWNLEEPGLIWTKQYSELGMPQPYYTGRFSLSPDMKYLMVQSGHSATQRPTLINLQTFTSRISPLSPGGIMADNTVMLGDYKGDTYRWSLDELKLIEPLPTKKDWFASPDKTKYIIPGKKYKAYDIFTRQTAPYDYQAPLACSGHPWATPIAGGDFAEGEPNNNLVVLYDQAGKEKAKIQTTKGKLRKVVGVSASQSHIYTLEHDNIYSTTGKENIYRNYLVAYRVPDGEVMWSLLLNASGDDIQKMNEQKKADEEEEAKKKREAREQMLANAKPGYKEFDAKFTQLQSPYTMDYNAAQGFALAGDQFMSDFRLQSGSLLYGMGKICSCEDRNAYLLMIRNQSGSADRSNFLIATYDAGGKEISVKNIGTTQKDPSGIIRVDFTITMNGCSGNVTTKTTYPNGHTENGNLQISRCSL